MMENYIVYLINKNTTKKKSQIEGNCLTFEVTPSLINKVPWTLQIE